jgi:hypothetical protein
MSEDEHPLDRAERERIDAPPQPRDEESRFTTSEAGSLASKTQQQYVAQVEALKAEGDLSLLHAHPELADPKTLRDMQDGVKQMFGAAGISHQDLLTFVANNPWIHAPLAQEFLYHAVKNYRAERKTRTTAALQATKSRRIK